MSPYRVAVHLAPRQAIVEFLRPRFVDTWLKPSIFYEEDVVLSVRLGIQKIDLEDPESNADEV